MKAVSQTLISKELACHSAYMGSETDDRRRIFTASAKKTAKSEYPESHGWYTQHQL